MKLVIPIVALLFSSQLMANPFLKFSGFYNFGLIETKVEGVNEADCNWLKQNETFQLGIFSDNQTLFLIVKSHQSNSDRIVDLTETKFNNCPVDGCIPGTPQKFIYTYGGSEDAVYVNEEYFKQEQKEYTISIKTINGKIIFEAIFYYSFLGESKLCQHKVELYKIDKPNKNN